MPAKVFFDTNVLVYAHDADAPAKRKRSQELIFESLRAMNGVLSAQVLSEFFVTVTQKVAEPMTVGQARSEILLLARMQVVEIDATLVVKAIDTRSAWKVNYWDALILAAAERAGCVTLYSEDLSKGQSYGCATVVNPFA